MGLQLAFLNNQDSLFKKKKKIPYDSGFWISVPA